MIDDDYEIEYDYAWRVKLSEGIKFDDDSGQAWYTDEKFKVGDEIWMVLDQA